MSLKNLRLLNPSTISLEWVLRWIVSHVAWENEDLEFQKRDGGFETTKQKFLKKKKNTAQNKNKFCFGNASGTGSGSF
jgi:hypothetical protein